MASRPGRLNLGEYPRYQFDGRLVGSQRPSAHTLHFVYREPVPPSPLPPARVAQVYSMGNCDYKNTRYTVKIAKSLVF